MHPEKTKHDIPRSSIGRKLIIHILLFSSAVTFLGTSLQLYVDYASDLEAIQSTLTQIDSSYLESISNSLWSYDNEQLNHLLTGILRLPHLQHVEIRTKTEILFSAGKQDRDDVVQQEFPLLHRFKGQDRHLGNLVITASLKGVYERLYKRIALILSTQTAKTFLVSAFIYFLFHTIVGKHLGFMAAYAKRLDLDLLNDPLELKRKPPKHNDELDVLVRSINIMRNNIAHGLEERRLVEKALEESETKYRSLFYNNANGIFIYSLETMIILDANPAMTTTYGYSREELVGMNCLELSADVKASLEASAKINKSGRLHVKLRWHKKKDGTVFPLELDVFSMELENKTVGYAIVKDISKRMRAEEKIKQYSENLEEMVSKRTIELRKTQEELRLKERLAVLGHFAGSISHELRNPLAAIDLAAYFLDMKLSESDDKVKRHLETIFENVKKSTVIIQSLLNLSRMEKPKTTKTDLAHIVSETFRSTRIPETVEVILDYAGEPVFVETEAEQIRMVFKNIVQNAIQAMNEKGKLTISTRSTETGFIEIRLADTGGGISPEHIDRIFEPLFSTKTHGIGFGLSIAKMIVENHEGTIRAESSPGNGAVFIVTLPLAVAEEEQKHSIPAGR